MRRLPGWRRRMAAFIDEVRRHPLAWGEFDCGPAFAGRHVELMTGDDLAARWRGQYDSPAGALRLIRAAGFGDLGDLVASLLPEIHPSTARIGDLAGVPAEGGFGIGLGIVAGDRIFVLHPDDGLGTVDLLAARRAWRVGDA